MCISLAVPTKYAFSPEMSFGSPGTDFDPILVFLGVPGGAKNEEKALPGGGLKKRQLSRPLFFRFWLILGPLKGPKPRSRLLLFRSFSDPGGYFFCSGLILGNFEGLCCFRRYFPMMLDNVFALIFANAVALAEPRF